MDFRTDPLKDFKGGEKVRFSGRRFPLPEIAPRIADAWPFDYKGICLAISFADSEQRTVIPGSGVIVAPGLALCATHVVEKFLPGLATGELSAGALGFIEETTQIWGIRGISPVPSCDISFLQLEAGSPLPPDNNYFSVSLTTRCPRIGETVSMFGFRGGREEFEKGDNRLSFIGCTGIMREPYLSGRDTSMLPFPCVEVDCPALGGMSGGPVFDSRGYLFAMITTAIVDPVPEKSSPMYASLLWPAMTHKVQVLWPEKFIDQPASLLQLDALRPRICEVEGAEAISLNQDGTPRYTPWS